MAILRVIGFFLTPAIAAGAAVAQTGAPMQTVRYACDQGRTIVAEYFEGTAGVAANGMPIPGGRVSLALSDGRRFDLPQTVSGSGIRYADKADKADKAPAKADKAPAGRGKRETAPPPAAAAPTAGADSAQARLFISLGKKHGVSADDLRALLAGPVGGDQARIGSVSLRDSHAHVRVPEDMAEVIIAGVHGTQHNDEAVTVERARA